mmetsp:Transcript_55891/g.162020  ORF Transcript_55891/g.162020 Transcript_55891/m.162020 type:complete len:454 (-) Transcript_55891:177-1538(-)
MRRANAGSRPCALPRPADIDTTGSLDGRDLVKVAACYTCQWYKSSTQRPRQGVAAKRINQNLDIFDTGEVRERRDQGNRGQQLVAMSPKVHKGQEQTGAATYARACACAQTRHTQTRAIGAPPTEKLQGPKHNFQKKLEHAQRHKRPGRTAGGAELQRRRDALTSAGAAAMNVLRTMKPCSLKVSERPNAAAAWESASARSAAKLAASELQAGERAPNDEAPLLMILMSHVSVASVSLVSLSLRAPPSLGESSQPPCTSSCDTGGGGVAVNQYIGIAMQTIAGACAGAMLGHRIEAHELDVPALGNAKTPGAEGGSAAGEAGTTTSAAAWARTALLTKACPCLAFSTWQTSRKRSSCNSSRTLAWPSAVSLSSSCKSAVKRRLMSESVATPGAGLRERCKMMGKPQRTSSHVAYGKPPSPSCLESPPIGNCLTAFRALAHFSDRVYGTVQPPE